MVAMASTKRSRTVTAAPRVSRTYRLPLKKISDAQRALGTKTATETIERALDLASFQQALVEGPEAMFGVKIAYPDRRR
jgi:hypothetical protein